MQGNQTSQYSACMPRIFKDQLLFSIEEMDTNDDIKFKNIKSRDRDDRESKDKKDREEEDGKDKENKDRK